MEVVRIREFEDVSVKVVVWSDGTATLYGRQEDGRFKELCQLSKQQCFDLAAWLPAVLESF